MIWATTYNSTSRWAFELSLKVYPARSATVLIKYLVLSPHAESERHSDRHVST